MLLLLLLLVGVVVVAVIVVVVVVVVVTVVAVVVVAVVVAVIVVVVAVVVIVIKDNFVDGPHEIKMIHNGKKYLNIKTDDPLADISLLGIKSMSVLRVDDCQKLGPKQVKISKCWHRSS